MPGRIASILLTVGGLVMAFLLSVVAAEEATGKVVFVDGANKGLLIEVPKGGGGIPGAKEGETFTFVIPSLEMVKGLSAGDTVVVKFEEKEGKDGPRTLTAVTKK